MQAGSVGTVRTARGLEAQGGVKKGRWETDGDLLFILGPTGSHYYTKWSIILEEWITV